MTEIICAIILGIVLGCLDVFGDKVKRHLNTLSNICLFIMIFCLAAKVGCDTELIASLQILGVQSLALTVGVIAGSLICVYCFTYFFRSELETMVKEDSEK